MKLRSPLARWLMSLIMSSAVIGAGCGDDTHGITPGMSEHEVISRLGNPTMVITERELMMDYFYKDLATNCLPKTTKVLRYKRLLSKNVNVAIDSKGVVLCLQTGFSL